MKIFTKAILLALSIILIDQILKIWIKTHMYLGQEFNVFGNWFIIHFTENNGMAFGMEFEGSYGKLFLTLFRVVAISALTWYVYDLSKKNANKGYILCMGLILAGAVGNLIDSLFYGICFGESYAEIASFFPEGGGYAPFLHGKVVDMLYFPIMEGHFPQWFPIWGGEEFMFFRPVFNIADSAISVGVALILIFQKRYFEEVKLPEQTAALEQEKNL